MTQPVQEPTTDRALQGFAYARDQIFRRPAPQPVGDYSCAYFDEYGYEGDGSLITTNTWTEVAGGTDPDIRYFTEFFRSGDEWGHDFDSGLITNNTPAIYLATGTVTFGGPISVTTTLELGIQWGAGDRHPFALVQSDNVHFRVTGTAQWAGDIVNGVHLLVWHNEGSDIELDTARLHVERFCLLADGEYIYREVS